MELQLKTFRRLLQIFRSYGALVIENRRGKIFRGQVAGYKLQDIESLDFLKVGRQATSCRLQELVNKA